MNKDALEAMTEGEHRAHQLRLELDCLRDGATNAAAVAPGERTDDDRHIIREWEYASRAFQQAQEAGRQERAELDRALLAEGLTD